MEKLLKAALTALVILYVVSPLDACQGPIDDILVILLSLAARERMRITD